MTTFTGLQAKSILKICLSNLLFFSTIGLIANIKNLHQQPFFLIPWIFYGLLSSLILVGLAFGLQRKVNHRRQTWLSSELSQIIHSQFNTTFTEFFHLGKSNNIVWSLGWHLLPAPKLPKTGLLLNIVFRPQKAHIVYEAKKALNTFPILHHDNFYFSFFFTGKIHSEEITEHIKAITKELDQRGLGFKSFQCVNCGQENKKTEIFLSGFFPLPLCPKCVKQLPK